MTVPVQKVEDDAFFIFSPPNTVNFSKIDNPVTQPDPDTYIAPTKAAGDVSLTGPQLVAFLTKATLKLPKGTTREGIQLRIGQFNDLVTNSKISELCLKKLNFVVDAIDRGVYDEAWQFFEPMLTNFPKEMKMSWAHGVKILIVELKKALKTQPKSSSENKK